MCHRTGHIAKSYPLVLALYCAIFVHKKAIHQLQVSVNRNKTKGNNSSNFGGDDGESSVSAGVNSGGLGGAYNGNCSGGHNRYYYIHQDPFVCNMITIPLVRLPLFCLAPE